MDQRIQDGEPQRSTRLQGKLCDEEDKKLKIDHGFESNLKSNEAYSFITHYIPIDENGAYTQNTLQILTEDNVAYGQTVLATHESQQKTM